MSTELNISKPVTVQTGAVAPAPATLVPAAPQPLPETLLEVPAEQASISEDSHLVMHGEPRGPAADRFRYLRLRLRELRQKAKLKSLTVTSAIPKDGKSTIVLNLATTLAEGGKFPVLVVEADLHRPRIASTLALPPKPGLAECIEVGLNPLDAITRVEPLGWYLIQAGEPQHNPTELLQSQGFAAFLQNVEQHFDWIIFDTPPVLPLTDSISISRRTDATILVVRAGKTPVANVDEAVNLIGSERIAAIVLNAVEGLNKLYNKYSSYYGKKS